MHAAERQHTEQIASALPSLIDQGLCTRLEKATQKSGQTFRELHFGPMVSLCFLRLFGIMTGTCFDDE